MAITLDQLRSFGGVNAMKLDATGEDLQSVNKMHRFKSFFNIGNARQENAQTLSAIRDAIQNDPRYHLQGAKEHIDAMLNGIRTDRAIKAADIRRIVSTVDQMFANAAPAKREAAADFVADVLFKGKEYRGETANALKYGEDLPGTDYEASLSALEEIAQKDKNLFARIMDAVKRFISSLKNHTTNNSVVRDLEKLEKKLKDVYRSAETNRPTEDGGVKYYASDGKKSESKKLLQRRY